MLRRGFVTFDPSGHPKTVYATFRALKSCTTSTNHFARNVSASLANIARQACFSDENPVKLGVGSDLPKIRILNQKMCSKDLKNHFLIDTDREIDTDRHQETSISEFLVGANGRSLSVRVLGC